MGIDATTKTPPRAYTPLPDEIKMDEATKVRVDTLWPKLGLPPNCSQAEIEQKAHKGLPGIALPFSAGALPGRPISLVLS